MSTSLALRSNPRMPIFGRLAEQSGEPEAFQDALELLFADRRGNQRHGLGLVYREANLAGALDQNVGQGTAASPLITLASRDDGKSFSLPAYCIDDGRKAPGTPLMRSFNIIAVRPWSTRSR